MKLLGNDGRLRVHTKRRGRHIGQQARIARRLRSRGDGVTKTDIDLQRDARAVQRGSKVNTRTAIARFLANRAHLHRGRVEPDAVVNLHRAERTEHIGQRLRIVRPKAKQIGIPGW